MILKKRLLAAAFCATVFAANFVASVQAFAAPSAAH